MSSLVELHKDGLDWIDSKASSKDVDEYWDLVSEIEPILSKAISNGFNIATVELILALSLRTSYENG